MNGDLYELVALFMRYFFAAIMVLIVARAWKITVVDSGRANRLRYLAPETGLCGEFLVMTGEGRRACEGMRYAVIREGLIGSSRKADVRVRAASVGRAHATFERVKGGLRVRAQARAPMYDGAGMQLRETILGDGDRVTFGAVELMLILTDGQDAPGHDRRDDLFGVAPQPRARSAQQPDEPDAVFDSWDEASCARQERDALSDWDAPKKAPRPKATGDDFFDI